VALLDIVVTSIDSDGECRTQEIYSGLVGRDQFLGGQNGAGKIVSIRVVVELTGTAEDLQQNWDSGLTPFSP
jgi:hypothetical protein